MRSLTRTTRAVLVGALLASSACSKNLPATREYGITTDDAAAEGSLRAAEAALHAGDLARAALLLEKFTRDFSSDPLRPIAELDLALIRMQSGNAEQLANARRTFAELLHHPDRSLRERADFYDAVAEHLSGHPQRARDRLIRFVGQTVDPAETALLYETLAAASTAISDWLGALRALDLLAAGSDASDPDARRNARARVDDIVRTKMSPEQIDAAQRDLEPSGYAWAMVTKRAVREAFRTGHLARVRQLSASLRARGVPFDADLDELALWAEQNSTPDIRAIGLILPLTGDKRELGRSALRGALLAAGLAQLDGPPVAGAPKLLHRDDGSDPERAAHAVDDLVTLHRVIAIIGPMESETIVRATTRADELGISLIKFDENRVLELPPTFDDEYRNAFHVEPDAAARFGYSSVKRVMLAIQRGANNRRDVTEELRR